jgi:hypothetical protein
VSLGWQGNYGRDVTWIAPVCDRQCEVTLSIWFYFQRSLPFWNAAFGWQTSSTNGKLKNRENTQARCELGTSPRH